MLKPRGLLTTAVATTALLLTAGTCAAKDVVTADRTATPPTIDGQLDEPVWQRGSWHSGLRDLGRLDDAGRRLLAQQQAHYRLAIDDQTIYFAARLDEPNVKGLRADVTERDGKVWQDDSIELCLDRTGRGGEHFQFIVNANGVVFDAHRDQGGKVGDMTWNARVRAAATRHDDHWTVEMAISLADLQLAAHRGGLWLHNVARSRFAGSEATYSCVAPTKTGFHDTATFAPLAVDADHLDRYRWSDLLLLGHRMLLDEQQIALAGGFMLNNDTGVDRKVQIRFEVERSGKQIGRAQKTLSARSGLPAQVNFQLPIDPAEASGAALMWVSVFEADSDLPIARKSFPVDVNYRAIEIGLRPRLYRNSLYATQARDDITGSITVNFAEAQLRETRLSVRIVSEADELASRQVAQVTPENPFRLPTSDLPVGKHRIVATLSDRDGKTLAVTEHPLRVLPEHEREVRIDEHGVTLINGEPFLPFGWFSIAHGKFERSAREGYNVCVTYDAYYWPEDYLDQYLSDAHALGIGVVMTPLPRRDMVDEEAYRSPLSEADAEAIRARVARWKDHPGLLGWYMGDEIEAAAADIDRMRAIYVIVADEDPYHPAILLNNTIAGMERYVAATDVLMPDPYPLFHEPAFAARGLSYLGSFVRTIPKLDGGRAASWLTPEGFNYGDFGQPRGRAPSFDELRAQLYLSAALGTTGWVWYSHAYGTSYTAIREGMPFLACEAAALKAAILTPQRETLTIAPAGMVASYRRVDGAEYIFAANPTETDASEVRITLPDGASATWYVVSEDRTVDIRDGVMVDALRAYRARVYTTDAKVAGALSLAEARRRIADADAQAVATGNVALRNAGATATASSRLSGGTVASWAIDGLRLNPSETRRDNIVPSTWHSRQPAQLPEWLRVDLPQPRTIGRVRLQAYNVAGAHVEVLEDQQWRRVGDVERLNAIADEYEATFPAQEAAAFRVVFTALTGGNYVRVAEIEAYAQ